MTARANPAYTIMVCFIGWVVQDGLITPASVAIFGFPCTMLLVPRDPEKLLLNAIVVFVKKVLPYTLGIIEPE